MEPRESKIVNLVWRKREKEREKRRKEGRERRGGSREDGGSPVWDWIVVGVPGGEKCIAVPGAWWYLAAR